MNNITQHLLAISIALTAAAMNGCGQTGGLFLPGQGTGYYKSHTFTERPVHATQPNKEKEHTP